MGLIVTSLASMLTYALNYGSFVISAESRASAIAGLVFAVIQVLLGFAILKRMKIAYYAFMMIAILQMLFSGLTVVSSLLAFIFTSVGSSYPPVIAFTIFVTLLVQIALLALYIYGLVVLSPARVRQLFR